MRAFLLRSATQFFGQRQAIDIALLRVYVTVTINSRSTPKSLHCKSFHRYQYSLLCPVVVCVLRQMHQRLPTCGRPGRVQQGVRTD